MQNKNKLPHAQSVDARLPFALCYAIGVILLSALEVLCYLTAPGSDVALYGLMLLTFFIVIGGFMLLAYLLRVHRLLCIFLQDYRCRYRDKLIPLGARESIQNY